METVDLVGLLVPITYFVFLATERLWPARTFPPRRGWQWIGLGFLVMVLTLSTVIPLLIPETWLARHRFLDGTGLGVVGGTLVGVVVLEGVVYAWHRGVHSAGFLGRGFHQMHHAPQRVHHRMGVHYYNYADLPFWDMLFGTFRNPRQFMGQCGFEGGADRRVGAIFGFVDVNAPLYGPGNLGAKPDAHAGKPAAKSSFA